MVVNFVSRYFYYIFLGLIILTVIQRKQGQAGAGKRLAVLITAILFFIMYIGALGIKMKNFNPVWLLLPLFVDISLIYVLRDKLLIFKSKCRKCGKKLEISDILYIDSNKCSTCRKVESSESA